jgi:hypothetical protein
MRYLLALILVGIVIAGCSSRPEADEPAKETTQDNRGIPDIAPEGRITEEAAPNEADSSLPVVTVDSPPILLTPIQGNATPPSTPNSPSSFNWQTFTSSALGIAVDYPLDWSVAEETDGTIFTSPQSTTITLQAVNAIRDSNETRIGNQRCTSRTNAYGLTADVCVDSASFIYTAKFTLQAADGSTRWLTLSTKSRTTGDVFEGMFNSLRLVK